MNDFINDDIKDKIRKIYRSNPVATVFLDWCAERQRDVRETTIDRMIVICGCSRMEAVTLAKQLAEVGCGEFIVGRRGAISRFSWAVSRISLGRVAIGEADDVEDVEDDPIPEEEDEGDAATSGAGINPASSNLTISEAKTRLAAALGVSPDQIEINIRA